MKGDEKKKLYCPNCEDDRNVHPVTRDETYTVRGEEIIVSVETMVCSMCGESIGNDEQDQKILDAVHEEYRRRVDLLTPDRIREIRNHYHLSQKSFAMLLGMSEATMNRYEQGGLQDQTHDTVIRACEKPEVIRDLLSRRGHLISDWQRKRVEQALAGQEEPANQLLDHLGEVDWVCMPKEVSEKTGYRIFDYKRFAGVVLSFCDLLGEISRTTINKLLFYADFLNYKISTVSLTGTTYRKLDYGPVPADYGGLLSRMESEGLLFCEERPYPNGKTGFYYSKGSNADSMRFDFDEIENRVLNVVARDLGSLKATEISEKSHQETAWKDTEEKQLISYIHAMDLSLSLS
ncbi:MAG: DUF4065 domain-containing protein [Phycisphaerae bacterium]|nr:DUF4065 domain-containing protein [Phycisphaerae bacterium]